MGVYVSISVGYFYRLVNLFDYLDSVGLTRLMMDYVIFTDDIFKFEQKKKKKKI